MFTHTGKAWSTKVDEVREKMKAKDCKGLVVTALDEIACENLLLGKGSGERGRWRGGGGEGVEVSFCGIAPVCMP